MPFKVLVTGGNGFLGQHVIKHLQIRAPFVDAITILDKNSFVKKLEYQARIRVNDVVGSIMDYELVKSALKDIDCVIHLAGVVSVSTFPDVKAMQEVNVKGTQILLEACVAENIGMFIFCSTADTVVGCDDMVNITEDYQTEPNKLLFGPYAQTKLQAEQLVLGMHDSSLRNGGRLRTVTLRPSGMYGELDCTFVPVVIGNAIKASRILPHYGNPDVKTQHTNAGNAAWAIVCTLSKMKMDGTLGGEVFFIADNTPQKRIFEFCEPFLEIFGCRLASKSIPYTLFLYIVILLEFLVWVISPFKKIYLPTTSGIIRYANKNCTFSYKKARDYIDYTPLYSWEESKKTSLSYYKTIKF